MAFIDLTEVSDTKKPALLAIFSPFYLHDTLILSGAFFFNLFAVYSVFNWAPALMTSMGLDLANASRTVAAYNFGAVIGAIALRMAHRQAWFAHLHGLDDPPGSGLRRDAFILVPGSSERSGSDHMDGSAWTVHQRRADHALFAVGSYL